MTREQALQILHENLTNQNMIKHCLASGAVMKALAKKLGEDENVWELAGLLHDADAEATDDQHQGIKIGNWLRDGKYKGLIDDSEVLEKINYAMASHGYENTGVEPKSKMDWALFAGEKLTGLIVATTLVLPSKKLADVTTDMILRRFKEKAFARGAKRESILECQKIGLELEEFVDICLKAMQKIADYLGL